MRTDPDYLLVDADDHWGYSYRGRICAVPHGRLGFDTVDTAS